jgi:hypothetical protein
MVGQRIGHVRVSTLDKTRQADSRRYGIALSFHVNATATHTASNARAGTALAEAGELLRPPGGRRQVGITDSR